MRMDKNTSVLRTIDLYAFLKVFDPTGWKLLNDHQLIGVIHDSCIITKGKGWSWFSKGLFSRNPIDFLILYYEISFQEALKILYEFTSDRKIETYHNNNPNIKNKLPPIKETRKPWRELYSYLCYQRCINKNIIDIIVNKQLAYQTYGKFPNICFITPEKTHWEIVGTSDIRYKRISDASSFWMLPFASNKCFVAESAIDAISLYALIKDENATYVSIGGSLSRTKLIKTIVENFDYVILAVDNDDAGNETSNRFPFLDRIIPFNKDFNEDLIQSKKQNKTFKYHIKKAGGELYDNQQKILLG